ncbi:hypothetical protein ACQRIT_007776 [Beauveria bassiana]
MTYPLRPHGPSLAGHRPHSAKPFLNRGYAITWLDQDLPAFTTPQYALHPFSPLPSLAPLAGQRADKLDRSCRRPPPRNGPVKMSFLDGRGCNATNIVPHPVRPKGLAAGRTTAWNTFLATWGIRGADLRVRAEAYTSVHKMLFSVAYAQLLVDMLPPPPGRRRRRAEGEETLSKGRVVTARYGVVVNYTFSALVEGFSRLRRRADAAAAAA